MPRDRYYKSSDSKSLLQQRVISWFRHNVVYASGLPSNVSDSEIVDKLWIPIAETDPRTYVDEDRAISKAVRALHAEKTRQDIHLLPLKLPFRWNQIPRYAYSIGAKSGIESYQVSRDASTLGAQDVCVIQVKRGLSECKSEHSTGHSNDRSHTAAPISDQHHQTGACKEFHVSKKRRVDFEVRGCAAGLENGRNSSNSAKVPGSLNDRAQGTDSSELNSTRQDRRVEQEQGSDTVHDHHEQVRLRVELFKNTEANLSSMLELPDDLLDLAGRTKKGILADLDVFKQKIVAQEEVLRVLSRILGQSSMA